MLLKKGMCGAINSYLHGQFSKFISAKHDAKAKLPFPLLENNCATVRGPWDQLGEEGLVNIMEKYKSGTVVILSK